jgi:mono/diheme cytochrome c family protein
MIRSVKLLALPLAFGLAAVAMAAAPHRPVAAKARAIARGHAFAEAHCTACHAITANGSSPNPEAPPWDDIANRPGVTAGTLAEFLADAHNYPAAMDFTVERRAIGDLAAYMLTLRRPGYKPTR